MIQKLAVVALWVDDFERAISFYCDILGLGLTTLPGEIPQFRVGDSLLVLVKGKFCPPKDAFPPDFAQVSFSVQDLDDMMAILHKNK